MDPSQATLDAAGRVHIVETDDRGQADTWTAPQALDVRQRGAFTELARIPLDFNQIDPQTGQSHRVLYVRGSLILSATVIPGSSFTNQYLAMEINVVGYVGSSASLLKRIGLDNNQNQSRYIWDGSEAWQSIGIEARQIVDGVPDGTTAVQQLTLGAVARLWR